MLSKIQELPVTEEAKKDEKFFIIPYISYFIHEGATSLGQVRISPKVPLSDRLNLPCAICWLYVVHSLTYVCFDHWNFYFISEVVKVGNPRDKEYLDPRQGPVLKPHSLERT